MSDRPISQKKSDIILENPENIEELTKNEIIELIKNVESILLKEPNLIRINNINKFLVIGDIHGNFDSLIAIHNLIKRDNYNYYQKIIFLGDYVDRGPKQVESINYVMFLKHKFPNKIILLRGNHETISMNQYYGFINVVNTQFGREFYEYYLNFYNALPLALITDTKIFCVHGGLPELLNTIDQINEINRSVPDLDFNDSILAQLLWNDPSDDIEYFSESFRGPGIKLFGIKAFQDFILKNQIKLFIRAHEAFLEGYKFFFENKLLSIFSASKYRFGNQAIVAEIKQNAMINLISID
ncbi:MAG: metallophosphoesterase [Candidatus Helarchaeota archaeon]